MNMTERGLVLLCDAHGMIVDVLRNDLGLEYAVPGRLFFRLADVASRTKAMDFLIKAKQAKTVLNWEWNVVQGNRTVTLHFSGGQLADLIMIVGATDGEFAASLYEDMLRISNEQTNLLRAAVKEQATYAKNDANVYDEISRLNNELVTMQRELAKANAELAALNDLKNQFLGMAAHDLRNPLGIILSYSEFLVDEATAVLSDEHAKFLSIIRASSEFMLQLVEDFLDVSIIESGKLQLDPKPVDLVALVESNVTLNRVLAEKKEIQLLFSCDARLPIMHLDIGKIEQVLSNLTSNAIKYSYPDSVVEVHVTQRDTDALISVRDQGQGIPANQFDKLFKLFGTTVVRSTDGEKSSGLGLAIAKRIIEEHCGEVWVESQPGKGTTFYVSLPFECACVDTLLK